MTRGTSRLVPTVLFCLSGIAAGFMVAPIARAQALPPEIGSVAVNDDGTALLTNPAAMCASVRSAFYLSWDHSETNSEGFGTGVFAVPGFGIGYQTGKSTGIDRVSHFLLGVGGARNATVSFGIRADRTAEHLPGNLKDSAWRWDLGLLMRPAPFLSIGAVGRDVTQSKFLGNALKRNYTVGIGLRPLPKAMQTRLTVFADASAPEERSWKNLATFHGGLWAEIAPGVQIGAAVDGPFRSFRRDRTFTFGVSLSSTYGSFLGTRYPGRNGKGAGSTQAMQVVGSRQPTHAWEDALAKASIGGAYGDESQSGLPIPMIGAAGFASVRPILRELDNARKDPSVRGVLLDLSPVAAGALADEIRAHIARLREAGKPVVAFSRDISNRGQYFIASACDRIVLDEVGEVASLGMRVDIPYFGEMLDSAGIRFVKVAHGKYKTAYEELVRNHASEGQLESLNSILDDYDDHFLSLVARDRKLDRAKIKDLTNGRLLSAEEARTAGLIDSIGDERVARRILARLAGMKGEPGTVSTRDWDDRDDRWGRRAEVAVLWLDGAIVDGRSTRGFMGGNTMGSETVVSQVRALAGRRNVKAVVLRVDSPGGSGLASDEIWRAVQDLKKKGKKVVVSMSRVAGSGGYYIACNADKIVAEPMTITGSIGVLWVKTDTGGFYGRHRVHIETLERGKYMGITSGTTGLTDEEREMVQATADRFYRHFLDRVHTGRGMAIAKIDSLGQGRIWTGRQALKSGLIDRLGGLDDAVALAKDIAGLPADARVENIHRPQGSWIERRITGAVARTGLGRDAAAMSAAIVATASSADPLALWMAARTSAGSRDALARGPVITLENPLLPILAAQP